VPVLTRSRIRDNAAWMVIAAHAGRPTPLLQQDLLRTSNGQKSKLKNTSITLTNG
jgi:hypothetical protein